MRYMKTSYDALDNVDVLLLLTEWDEFRSVDFARIAKLMRGKLVIDGRNIWDKSSVVAA